MPRYSIIDHPSDAAIEVSGKDSKELFENAAFGMMDMMYDLKSLDIEKYLLSFNGKVHVTADNLESLLVAWLSELLYISDSKKMQISVFHINKMSDNELDAIVLGGRINKVRTAIKAVTYSQMKILKIGGNLKTTIVFDV